MESHLNHDLLMMLMCSADSVLVALAALLVIYLLMRREVQRSMAALERRLHLIELQIKELHNGKGK